MIMIHNTGNYTINDNETHNHSSNHNDHTTTTTTTTANNNNTNSSSTHTNNNDNNLDNKHDNHSNHNRHSNKADGVPLVVTECSAPRMEDAHCISVLQVCILSLAYNHYTSLVAWVVLLLRNSYNRRRSATTSLGR